MSTAPTSRESQRRTRLLLGAALHLGVAIALITIAVNGASALLPVSLSLRTAGHGEFAVVDLAAAAVIVALIAVLCRVFAATASRESHQRGLWYLEFSQLSGITVFLVAQLNGITEAGTLILCYAIAAGLVALLWVQSRATDDLRRAAWPFCAGAAIAVVPWGIVALYQVTGLALDAPLAPLVRVMTVVMLALFAALWWIERRWQLGLETDARADVVRAAVTVAMTLSLLVLAVGLARPSALL